MTLFDSTVRQVFHLEVVCSEKIQKSVEYKREACQLLKYYLLSVVLRNGGV